MAKDPSLRRIALCLSAALALPLAASALQDAEGKASATFPSQTDLVTVDVTVLDRKGNPVEGLGKDDFVLSEDGRPQTVSSFEAVGLPESEAVPSPVQRRVSVNTEPAPRTERTFFLVFDDAHLSPTGVDKARAAVRRFLTDVLEPGSRVTVVATSGGSSWTAQVPAQIDDVMGFLARLGGLQKRNPSASDSMSDYEAMRLYVNRDANVMTEVIRRYYENGVVADLAPTTNQADAQSRADLQISPGELLIRAKAAETYTDAKARNEATLGVLRRVVESAATARGRKVVILVSGGFIYDPTLPELREVEKAARQANAVIYYLDPRGLSGPSTATAEMSRATDERDLSPILDQETLEAEGSRSIAIDSGGFSIQNTNNLEEGFRRIAREARNYYLLGFVSSNTRRDGTYRKLKVTVTREDVVVHARKGYYAPSSAVEAPSKEANALDPVVRRDLDSPFSVDAIPLRLASYVLGERSTKRTVLLVADANPASLSLADKGGRFEGALESFVVVASRDTGETFTSRKRIDLSLPREVRAGMTRRWLPIVRDFELPPGTYQARLLVRDVASGRVGVVRHEFEVPDPRPLQLSSPILTDTVEPGPGGQGPQPVPLARRTFTVGTRLFCAYEVYGARPDPSTRRPRVSAGYVIKNASGVTLASTALAPLDPGPSGGVSQVVVLSLAGVAPGDYRIELTARDETSQEDVKVEEPFRVEPAS
jgi:VWFA-related protein